MPSQDAPVRIGVQLQPQAQIALPRQDAHRQRLGMAVMDVDPQKADLLQLLDFMYERPAAKDALRGKTFVRQLH